ncbi:MAG: tetratricopeptide repeat protein [Planctomycetes bacterium]|nr:tetratricopeptide repeat protein [Planctomycetota bacterium]
MATAEELFLQGIAAHQTGDLDTAERCYRQLLGATPGHAPCLSNLASIVSRRDPEEALGLFRRAIAAGPDLVDAHFNLGNLYRRLGRSRDAAAAYEDALRIVPDAPAALVNLGLAVSDDGNWARAVECFARAATVAPHLPDALVYLGDALARVGRVEEAVLALRESVARFPDVPRGHYNLGVHLAASGSTEEAITEFERALQLSPDYAEAHNALGVALETVGRADDAQREYREALGLKPEFADAWANLGTSLGEQGRCTEGVDALRHALALAPNAGTGSTLLANLLYSAVLSSEQLRDEHAAWASRYADPLAPAEPPRRRARVGNERVRVGYVFGEFRSRAALAFVEALLAHHDRARFHVTVYASPLRPDDAFTRLRRLADTWRPVTRLSDHQLADLIRGDEIDILADLNGHASGHRLMAFARKPAAVQLGMFSYPATTGMRAMDYRVTDPTTDPPGQTDALYVEKLLRLPDLGWVYVPPADAPAPAAPKVARRSFTFGCLNHPGKLSDPCVGAWAAILKAVPRSRLVLLAGQSVASAEAIAARFTSLGVSSDRLELVYRLPSGDYFEAYQPLDLALDPFPYGGAVTTCDALWMGVPVLTVAGRDARGRQGMSLLSAIGLPEFVADTPEQLVSLAATWAEQRGTLAELRGTLREMMQQSPITAAAEYVKHLEAAYRSV